MTELLDQNNRNEQAKTNGFKQLSTVLLLLSLGIVLFTLGKIWYTRLTLSSPWLPEYTVYYINSTLINFSVIQFGGFIPALFLRIRKLPVLSSICMIAFLLAAVLLKYHVKIYELFY